jgi:HEAT repeat protein
MFTGGVTWQSGRAASGVLEGYLIVGRPDRSLPVLPRELADILGKCFRRVPAERWASMAEVGEAIRRVYRKTVGKEHQAVSAGAAVSGVPSPAVPPRPPANVPAPLPAASRPAAAAESAPAGVEKALSTRVAALKRQLAERDTKRVSAAAEELGNVGAAARPAITALVNALVNADKGVRDAAAEALKKIEPDWASTAEAEAAVPILVLGLESLNDDLSHKAIDALGRIGAPAVQDLIEAVTNISGPQADTRRAAAARALGRVGPAAKAAVPTLRKLLKHAWRELRQPAAEGLGGIGAAAGDALPDLIEALRDQFPSVWRAAAEAIGKMGPAALPHLKQALEKGARRDKIALALQAIDPQAAQELLQPPAPPAPPAPAAPVHIPAKRESRPASTPPA